MIAKITGGKSIYGVLRYNGLKAEDGKAEILLQNNMLESPDNHFDLGLCMRSFAPYLFANRRTEKPVIHISLNPDPKDRVTDRELSEMAQRYMKEMGYGNQPYIAFKHTDIDRQHLHVVSVRVDESGKKIKSDFENRRSMEICRKLEQEYGLHVAGKEERTDTPELKKLDYPRGDVKHQIGNIVKYLFEHYRFQSFEEFRTLLELFNVTVEEVKGAVYGRPYHGLLYVATDDNGKRIGTLLKSSLFGKSVGYEALEERFKESARLIREERIREKLYLVLKQVVPQVRNREDFTERLKEKGIGVVFRQNEDGRIYGVTFIDHGNRTVLNGSRLGKEFSANAFRERFTENCHTEGRSLSPGNKEWNYRQAYNGNQKPERFEKRQEHETGGLGGLWNLPLNPVPDYAEPLWIEELRRKRKKKKRGWRR
ncbi:conjugal transfer protein MobB [Odoribacter sp. Z80]|uniref:conjugal transfer protein MobB n=1 Tax=Odoribacter sp. Z80 TaxID=2304575 RepID=UPI00137A8D02|nr:conjugal transfer protein MobB [Odoribacter sp. Z80]NCE73232.1 mobilization protein [Odoribacter sp. Z80]